MIPSLIATLRPSPFMLDLERRVGVGSVHPQGTGPPASSREDDPRRLGQMSEGNECSFVLQLSQPDLP
jgi:hypothetical protein